MAHPTQLNPTEQDALVKQIGLALLRAAPQDWEQIVIDYRAVGRHQESTGQVTTGDGEARPWRISGDIATLFAKLRAGMYREGRGTWFNARYQLDRPTSYNLEYDRDEPTWEAPPPPQAYSDELRTFPREEENVPDWLMRRLAGVGPERPGPHFRIARAFDGMGPAGRPVVNRPPIEDADIEDLLHYLDRAPVIIPGRGYDVDRLDAEARQSVPVAFHSDGTWIWPASVNYYLRKYRVPPEPELVDHARQQGFDVPEVDEPTMAAAVSFLDRVPRQGPLQPVAPPTQAMPVRPPAAPTVVAAPPAAPGPGRPPAAALPSQGGPGPTLNQLTTKLAEYGVPESVVRIGPPVENTWTLERNEESWRVGFFQRGEFVAPAEFADVADASAFLLGKVLMDTGWQRPPRPARVQQFQPEERFTDPSAIDGAAPVDGSADDAATVVEEPEAAPFRPIEQFTPETDELPTQDPEATVRQDDTPPTAEPAAAAFAVPGSDLFGSAEPADRPFQPEDQPSDQAARPTAFAEDDLAEHASRTDDRYTDQQADQGAPFADSHQASGLDDQYAAADRSRQPEDHLADEQAGPDARFTGNHQSLTDDRYAEPDASFADNRQASDLDDQYPAADRPRRPEDQFTDQSARPDVPFTGNHESLADDRYAPADHFADQSAGPDTPFTGNHQSSPSDDRYAAETDRSARPEDRFADQQAEPDVPFADSHQASGLEDQYPNQRAESEASFADTRQASPSDERYAAASDQSRFADDEPLRSDDRQEPRADEPYAVASTSSQPDNRFADDDQAAESDARYADDRPFQPETRTGGEPTRADRGYGAADRSFQPDERLATDDQATDPADQGVPSDTRSHDRFGGGMSSAADLFADDQSPFPSGSRSDSPSDGLFADNADHADHADHGRATRDERPNGLPAPFAAEGDQGGGSGTRFDAFGSADSQDRFMSSDPDDEPFRAQERFRPAEQFQPEFDAESGSEGLPDHIADTGPAVIKPDPATLAGAVEEPELLTHHQDRPTDDVESTQLHNPFDDEDGDEPDAAVDAPQSQPRRADLPQRDDRSTVDAGSADLGGAGLFTPTVPVDASAPRSASRPLARRANQEPAELFTPAAAVNGRPVDEPAEPAEPVVAAAPEPRPAPKPAGGPPWPIKPMDGEPPLTLFRGKEMRELPPGTELDRFGEPDGNLTYTVSTPFEQRSLVPDWVNRPYHLYRVVRPFEVLSGVAIPWFDQPGGGTAFLLPDSVEDLVDGGFLEEVADAKPPA